MGLVGTLAVVTASLLPTLAITTPAHAVVIDPGSGFTVTAGDLSFILKQIKIAERHAATLTPADPCGTLVGPNPNQIPDRLSSYGLRTVDGSCNNLFPGRETFAAADQKFPRLTNPVFRPAEAATFAGFPVGTTSYAQKTGDVFDSTPRTISNLIVDQTSTNPAAVAAAAFPVRTQGNPGLHPCTTDPDPLATPPVEGVPANCVPSHKTLFIPNVTTDVGLSPPYNSLFTFFGQFFDHGVDQTVKSGANVYVPLKADDPLRTVGPDGIAGTNCGTPTAKNCDEVPASQAFMVLTRAQNQPGPDGVLGTSDDVQDASNTDSPWVDQSQTYTSHASHQVFLRDYDLVAGKPVANGKLLGGIVNDDTCPADTTSPPCYNDGNATTGSISTWAATKKQAATKLGLLLADKDVLNIPMLATDPYGEFIPGPNGLPQYVTKTGLVEGNLANPVPVPSNVLHFDTPFLTDIAHNADPSPQDLDHNGTFETTPVPDANTTASADFASQAPGTYDDEMLNDHFTCGDGRCNENIALSTIHQIFHSEHDRLVGDIENTLATPGNEALNTAFHATDTTAVGPGKTFGYGERLFQAARFVTEMEYQHLVFEEFGRKVQPAIHPFHVYTPDVNPAIAAEFAHAVYRFGHSMLDDTVARTNIDGSDNSLPLLTAFLNPPEYFDGGSAGTLTPEQAAGSIVMGSSDQTGNELDEFVTETLRNNLLGLPLDLATLNLARARDAGIPPLNQVRRQINAQTQDGQMTPYTSWSDFGQHLKHPESLINFVAAYGQHPTITSATTLAAKRAAARAIVDPSPGNPTATPPVPADVQPADAGDFMFSTGAWSSDANGVTNTGLDEVDLWVGGLAEVTNLNGGLLGSTFNYVFQNQMEHLQDADRFYYLNRTPGMNLRTQLEGNSFSELIERNTAGTNTLKADAFATADCKFQLGNIVAYNGAPAISASATPPLTPLTGTGAVNDDPSTTDCDENQLLLQKPDGTVQYRAINKIDPSGINGQSVYNGTPGTDRVIGGNDNDTFWGGKSRDFIEGNGGDDIALGGDGNDIMTDLDGADVTKGGPGNDAVDSGPGNDISMGGDGSDFMNGGSNDNETFAGPGNDFVIAGLGADAVFGDGGDDWIQGGTGQDLLQGDHGAPFFDDPAETAPGNDVMVGQVGENDYDAEGGDDVMAQNAAIDRNAGAGGFDWAIHQYDTVAAKDDMMINNNLAGVPIQVVVNRDRWQETEADSGGPLDDSIKGTDGALATPRLIGGAGFIGCDAIDQAGMDRIKGLSNLLPPVNNWVGTSTAVAALSASGTCPLTGPVWGEGDILLGGPGNDTLEGRAGDEIIDGDRSLTVRISLRTNPADPATEVGSTDLMEHTALSGSFGPGTAGKTLQKAVFDGQVDPGNLVIVREIQDTQPSDAASVDTAVFTGPQGNYTVTTGNQTVTVTDNVGTDGTDTLRNIEKLGFDGGTTVVDAPKAPPVPTIGTALAADGAALVRWTPGTPNGAEPTGGFRIQVLQGGVVQRTVFGVSPTATEMLVDGLTNGTAYTFRVIAVNPAGISAPSVDSNAVTPVAAPPKVLASTPLNAATGFAVGSNVVVTFNKPVTSLNSVSVRLRNTTTNSLLATTLTYDAPTRTLTVDPSANLARATSYTLTLLGTGTSGIRDTGTPALRLATTTIQFTTASDTTPPAITTSSPLNNSLGFGLSPNLKVMFSERVVGATTGTVVLRNKATGVQIPGVVTTSLNGLQVTFNPDPLLTRNTLYELTVTGGPTGITDVVGNPLTTSVITFRTLP